MALNYSTHVNAHTHTHARQSERNDIRDASVLMAEEHAWREGMFAYLIFSRERERTEERTEERSPGEEGKGNLTVEEKERMTEKREGTGETHCFI